MELAIFRLPERRFRRHEIDRTSLCFLAQLGYGRNVREDVEGRQESLADYIHLYWR